MNLETSCASVAFTSSCVHLGQSEKKTKTNDIENEEKQGNVKSRRRKGRRRIIRELA